MIYIMKVFQKKLCGNMKIKKLEKYLIKKDDKTDMLSSLEKVDKKIINDKLKECNCKTLKELSRYIIDEFNKDYVAYTDNIYNSNNELQIYINEYILEEPECLVKDIIDNDEYNKIKIEINSILLTMKNESDKIDDIDKN